MAREGEGEGEKLKLQIKKLIKCIMSNGGRDSRRRASLCGQTEVQGSWREGKLSLRSAFWSSSSQRW